MMSRNLTKMAGQALCLLVTGLLMSLFMIDGLKPVSAAIPVRGVVEGFYGTPWTQEQRLDMLDFLGAQQMNAYIYAPKDDAYHRKLWREPYPANKLAELQALNEAAKKNKVQFIFAVSPGNDIDFDSAEDKAIMLSKLDAMYNLGIRQFALFFDDIATKDAAGQVKFSNEIKAELQKKYADIKPMILVPTEYYVADMVNQGQVKEYTSIMAEGLDKDIMVLYTGQQVCPDDLNRGTIDLANEVYHKPLGIWWNYPVNDYMLTKLALGPLDRMDGSAAAQKMPAFFVNPMEKPEMSKIAIATASEYALHPATYEPNDAWLRALKQQYGDLAEPMMVFASHSQHMHYKWANMGREDAKELQVAYSKFWQLVADNSEEVQQRGQLLLEDNAYRSQMLQLLDEFLPAKQKAECQLQLKQLQRMCRAERIALHIMLNNPPASERERLYQSFQSCQQEIVAGETQAKLSENTMGKFLTDFASWYESKYNK